MKKAIISLLALSATLTACNDFLDDLPDSRIEVDQENEVRALLVTAYPQCSHVRMTELASDNADDLNGEDNGYWDRFSEQCFNWKDITESDNQSPTMVWQEYYAAIAAANHALVAMNQMEQKGTDPETLRPYRGEALLCRAYSHFMLTNLFCMNYSEVHSATDPGVPYITEPETTLDPKYDRGTVAEDYQKIEKDLQDGLAMMSDAIYTVPRYHFNSKAAYTFASRFYLFYQKPDSVIKYANKVLGENPEAIMRDYDCMADMPTDNMQPRSIQYVSSSEKANLLLLPVYSSDQYYFSGTSMGSRFNHNSYIMQAESFFRTPWAPDNDSAKESQEIFKMYWFFSQVYNKCLFPKQPYYIEEVNATTHVGFQRTLSVALKSEEALLNRAEANILQGNTDAALADMNVWTNNFLNAEVKYNTWTFDENWNYIYATDKVNRKLTKTSIRKWYKAYPYYTPWVPTPCKHLNPEFISLTEGSEQEQMLQCLLLIRRLEFLHEGMRWFDVKRYGMKIYRRRIITALNTIELPDSMEARDPRQAFQIPFESMAAGIQPNVRQIPAASETPEYGLWATKEYPTFNLNQ